MKLNKKQIKFLNRCTDGVWTINKKTWINEWTQGEWTLNEKTGLVDIEGTFNCCHEELTDFKGVRFGVVKGYFDCSNNKLTSLEGSPQWVGGSFNCNNNSLTSLVGAPQEVRGDFSCSNNKLTSLVGSPQEVGDDFYCHDNKLTSLVGAPQEVGGYFYGLKNPISEETLVMVWETMQEKKIDYWTALCILNSQIPNGCWKKMSRGLDERLSKDAQKGVSMLGRFGHFD